MDWMSAQGLVASSMLAMAFSVRVSNSQTRCGQELCSGSVAEALLSSSKSDKSLQFICSSVADPISSIICLTVSPRFHTFVLYPGAISFPSTSGFYRL